MISPSNVGMFQLVPFLRSYFCCSNLFCACEIQGSDTKSYQNLYKNLKIHFQAIIKKKGIKKSGNSQLENPRNELYTRQIYFISYFRFSTFKAFKVHIFIRKLPYSNLKYFM